jgi:benzoyl-CoA reductase/2-hydroxyglutaryl-CoA dehydratase subunit BcrC/BadD/HgdB
MAQQADDMQKRLEYMNQVVQNSSLNAQRILGNNKRELQNNIFILADQDNSSFICTQGT